MTHQPHRHQPWRLDRVYSLTHSLMADAIQTIQRQLMFHFPDCSRVFVENHQEDRGNTLMPPSACRAALERAAPDLNCSLVSFFTDLATFLCAFTAAFRSFFSSGLSPRFLCMSRRPSSAELGSQLPRSAPCTSGAAVLPLGLALPAVRAPRDVACRGSCSCPGWLSRLVTRDSTLSQSHSRTAQASMVCVKTVSPSSVSRPALMSSLAYSHHPPQ